MKTANSCPRISRLKCAGLTVIELLVIIAILVLLAALLLPALAKSRPRSSRANCISNLKQVGLAFRMWSNDNRDRFPFAVPAKEGGTLEYLNTGEVWRHFSAISNEVNTPKVMVCPTDAKRARVISFDEFKSNASLSYLVGFDADETFPQSILTGDRHLKVNIDPQTRLAKINAGTSVAWTSELHSSSEIGATPSGNLGLADGSVMQANNSTLARQMQAALPDPILVTNAPGFLRLAIP